MAQTKQTVPFEPTLEAMMEAQKYLGNPEGINMEELPVDFNWEDIMGTDFTGRVMDQGGCGSCYMVSAVSMLEARIKVHFG